MHYMFIEKKKKALEIRNKLGPVLDIPKLRDLLFSKTGQQGRKKVLDLNSSYLLTKLCDLGQAT